MHDNEKNHLTDAADGVPSLLTILDSVENDHMQWIVPDPSSEFEGHAVFDKILPSFCRTPFKPHRVLWRIYVRTFLSI